MVSALVSCCVRLTYNKKTVYSRVFTNKNFYGIV
jgi:hypothetical protein